MELRIATYNVNGITDPTKRRAPKLLTGALLMVIS